MPMVPLLRLSPLARGLAAAALFAAGAASAQQAQKPAAGGAAAKTLGGQAAPSSGAMLDRNELRECIKRQDALEARKVEVKKQSDALLAERGALQKESEALNAERTALESGSPKTREFNDKMKVYADAAQAWNARVKEFNEKGGKGREAEAQRNKLNEEKAELDKTAAALEAERATLVEGVTSDAGNLNDRVAAINAKTVDWNARNAQQRKVEEEFENDRGFWVTECGGRRYREEDEKAIRAGR